MKKQLTLQEAMNAALSFFLNEIEFSNANHSVPLPRKHLNLIFLPDQETPISDYNLFEALKKANLDPDSVPEDVHIIEIETEHKSIRLQACKSLIKKSKDGFSYETALSVANQYFTNEILDPVSRWQKPPYEEKHCFLVILPKEKTPFTGATLAEALEQSGHNIENIPDEIFAYEFRSDGNNIHFRYAIEQHTEVPNHAKSGIYYCSPRTRGFAKTIRNQIG